MRTRIGWAAVLGATVAVTTQADDSTAPWEEGLPRVEATITVVGTGQYLWGSTLLLAAPDKFQGYWPDYGYRWSDAAYIELCGGALREEDGETPNLGRVRLVAESGDEAEQLIGVELRTRGGESSEVAESATEPADADTEFSVEELCALLDDESGRRRIETMVRLMAGTGINFLLEKAGLETKDIETGTLTLWADIAKYHEKYHEMGKLAEQKVWLVTENAIPARSLVPDIRVGEER